MIFLHVNWFLKKILVYISGFNVVNQTNIFPSNQEWKYNCICHELYLYSCNMQIQTFTKEGLMASGVFALGVLSLTLNTLEKVKKKKFSRISNRIHLYNFTWHDVSLWNGDSLFYKWRHQSLLGQPLV